jgi:ABC-2 type transport system ATP-binding protein
MPSALNARLRRAVPRVRLTRRRIIAGSAVVAVLLAAIGWAAWPTPVSYRVREGMITVRTGPSDDQEVALDTTLYLPKAASAAHPVPAVLLAHGFGGSKNSVVSDAETLADHGYAVLAWSAQGFGRSTGQIHLDSPDWEVKDAERLVDWLATRPDIRRDGPGDPRVAAVGGSYGGGLALMLAGYDPRVDAVVPMITWNDLAGAFLPESTGTGPTTGVFKKQWAGLFFGSGGGAGSEEQVGGPADGGPGVPAGAPPGGRPGGGRLDPQCGRFARDVCDAYLSVASTGQATPQAVALLRRSSPSSILDRVKAPTLLIQGEADSLFPLAEADANARGIAATGTPVQVAWFTGGHDGGSGPQSDVDRLQYLTAQWLDAYLGGTTAKPANTFTYSRITGIDTSGNGLVAAGFSVADYPGLAGADRTSVKLGGSAQRVANPPSGTPAAISSLPLAGSLASLANGIVAEIPGQHADFYSEPLSSTVDVIGSPTVRIMAASPTGEAVLFVKLYDVDAQGKSTLPNGLAAPVRLTGVPTDLTDAEPVTVTLPAVVHRFAKGHRVRIAVSTSDQAYSTPQEPAVYTIGLDPEASAVTLPGVAGRPIVTPDVVWRYVLAGLLGVLAVGLAVTLAVARRRLRRTQRAVVDQYSSTPLVVRGLRKAYADGFVAVSTVDFTVERNQVVGLLGPNGAGKTTTLRVLMGLTRATAGEILVYGHHLAPGAPVLSRVGALVEGPGFLPHLSGLANLRVYWRATGRAAQDAHLDEALDIAGLGDAVHRKVKTYSHGMKQRLAIAQAMLGLPDLLVLDEPTDGLDPPQIAEMRRVLRRYATDGRAVLVSSHLLAEVEQTCTDVVVMHKGEVVAAGPVADIVGDSLSVQFDVSDVDLAEGVLDTLGGVRSYASPGGKAMLVDINGMPRSEVVAALVKGGVGVDRVVPQRRLEDAFLALVSGNGQSGTESKDSTDRKDSADRKGSGQR